MSYNHPSRLRRLCLLISLTVLSVLPAYPQDIYQRLQKSENMLEHLREEEKSLESAHDELTFEWMHHWMDSVGLPVTKTVGEPVKHSAYELSYSEQHEQAQWVEHVVLTRVEKGNEGRSNDFRPDEKVKTGSAVEADYFLRIYAEDSTVSYDGFGFDRGHLAPAADFRYSPKAVSESFLYSNMSPQVADLNRGRWADMEDVVRQYVVRNQSPVLVVTGPVLYENMKYIERGMNKVSIPEYFFMAVMDLKNGRGIAFVMPNRKCDDPVASYAVSIDSVEKLSGMDLFSRLEDGLENRIESTFDVVKWVAERDLGNVAPLKAETMPRNTFNTVQAAHYAGKNDVITVCGTVVSTKLSSKGNIFLNLDRKFPEQIFTVTIFRDDVVNFSYSPDEYLMGKEICVKGKVTDFNGTPTMNVTNGKSIRIREKAEGN